MSRYGMTHDLRILDIPATFGDLVFGGALDMNSLNTRNGARSNRKTMTARGGTVKFRASSVDAAREAIAGA